MNIDVPATIIALLTFFGISAIIALSLNLEYGLTGIPNFGKAMFVSIGAYTAGITYTRLLPLLPADVHVLITSRSMPPAPLWRLRSKQSLVVIEEEALAFTRPEAIALFESYGLSSEQASIALDHSHGRAFALDEFARFLCKSEGKTSDQSRELRVAALPEQFV